MSNSLAIASVTATLRTMLSREVEPATVTTLPLDRAATQQASQRLNIFLYHIAPNAAWRNQNQPNRSRPNEPGEPPLALDLHYLVTAYGDEEPDESDHRLLGRAMASLHERPVLTGRDIRNATAVGALAESDLHEQIEKVRLHASFMSIDEVSKLWTTFQTPFRPSAAYQASVVLIDPRRIRPTPLPVLKRGREDRGVYVFASVPPILQRLQLTFVGERRPLLPAAVLSREPDAKPIEVELIGVRLPASNIRIVIRDPREETTLGSRRKLYTRLLSSQREDPDTNSTLPSRDRGDENSLTFRLTANDAEWVAGRLEIGLEYEAPNGDIRTTESIPFDVAPILSKNGAQLSYLVVVEGGRRKLVLYCDPAIGPGRVPRLLLTAIDGGQTPAPRDADRASPNHQPASPTFDVEGVPPGRYLVRLRVDAADSNLLRRRQDGAVEIDDEQVVVL